VAVGHEDSICLMGVDNPTMCREAILTRKDKSARWEAPGGGRKISAPTFT